VFERDRVARQSQGAFDEWQQPAEGEPNVGNFVGGEREDSLKQTVCLAKEVGEDTYTYIDNLYIDMDMHIHIYTYIYLSAERGKMASSRPCAWQRRQLIMYIYVYI